MCPGKWVLILEDNNGVPLYSVGEMESEDEEVSG